MIIEIDVTLDYRLGETRLAQLVIGAASGFDQEVLLEDLRINDAEIDRVSGEDRVGQRIWARLPSDRLQLTYQATVSITRTSVDLSALIATPLHQLPAETLQYLRPSRYVQAEKFAGFVARRFAGLEGGAAVVAIRDWVAAEMTYQAGSSNADTTALETFAGRAGVCRDYTHLVCALTRAAGIPARMAAVYGPDVTPPDFHAVAQVWLQGTWHLVDATGMSTPDRLAIIAVGRDAADVAFLDAGEEAELVDQTVQVTAVETAH